MNEGTQYCPMSTTRNQGQEGTTHHLTHEWDDETRMSDRIVAAIAEYEGEDADALPPLDGSINPDALDTLFGRSADGEVRPGCVTFSYYGYTVVVQSTGRILLRRD